MSANIDKLNAQAWNLRNEHVSESYKLAKKANRLSIAKNYQRGIAESVLNISHYQFKRSEFSNALKGTKEALKYFESIDDKQFTQRSLNTLGIIYGQTGDLTNALKTFLKTHKLCQALNDQEAEAHALNNLSIIYMHLGDYNKALEYNLQSLKIYQSSQLRQNEMRALQNIGVIYFELEAYTEALEYFQKAAEILKDAADKHTYALTLLNIGRTFHKLDDSDDALAFMQESLALMTHLEDTSGVSYALDALGKTLLDLGRLEESEAYLKRSLEIQRSLNDTKGETESCLNFGELYLNQGSYENAIMYFERGLELATKISLKAETYRAHRGLARAYKAVNQFEKVAEHLEQYIHVKDSLFSDNSDQRFQALRVQYEVDKTEKEKEIYRLKNVELAEMNSKLQALSEKLERQAIEDPLTGLYNRRHFESVLSNTYKRSFRHEETMSVMICDIDNFKQVNDHFSHAVGDEVLIQISQIFKDCIRETDTVARYGGEEFVILFPRADASSTKSICDRIRNATEQHPWHLVHPDLKVTISIGLCDDTTLGSGESMIARADDALYEVKNNGKNQVQVWQPKAVYKREQPQLSH